MFTAIAARLRESPARAEEAGQVYKSTHPGGGADAFRAGTLDEICRKEADAIESIVRVYLSAPPPKPRGVRRRR